MNHIPDSTEGVDLARYDENRAKYPPEQLLKYAGQYIAWNSDGTQVLTSGPDEETIERELESRGINPAHVVFSYVDPIYDEADLAAWFSAGDPSPPRPVSSRLERLEPPDISQYSENRAKYPPDELIKYAGQYVAWSPDGLRILAAGSDEESVERQLVTQGIDPSQVVLGYIDRLY